MRYWEAYLRPKPFRSLDQGIIDLSPPRMLALLLALLIGLGTVLLKLPWATVHPIGWLDALFTATSAVTVTGLTLVDTGTTFSLFGQVVLLVLVQLGGVGFMTFAVLILQLLGARLGLRQQIMLREALNHTSLAELTRLVVILFKVALVLELLAALLLATQWVPHLGLAEGLFYSLFHAVSAFNNAGFALHSDSLSRYVGNPLVNLVISGLYIIGGLGFAVLADLYRTRRFQRLGLHSKLMLSGTLLLSVLAMALVLALEWNNPATLGQLNDWGDRLWAAWFQATTPRSAGFNTLDTAALQPSTTTLTIGLMFIGGGSSSTAGGIKLTTFIILLLATRALLRQQPDPVIFGRAIPQSLVLKSLAIIVISLMGVFLLTFLLTISEQQPFLDLLFEAMSAFSTVGLSRGITTQLTEFGQGLLVLGMYVGRLGPLTLVFILAARRPARVQYPQDDLYVG